MIDAFKIDGPTVLQFSGGRSSAVMLHRTLERYEFKLPDCCIVSFENTGKEDWRTLRFIHNVSVRWGVAILWLEYRTGPTFAIVDYETASRAGEPYEAVIAHRGHILPNMRSPYCSSELKTRTLHRYLRSIGWTEWDTFIGVRADEPKRVANFRANPSPETTCEEIRVPLADAGIAKADVTSFWARQSFDLELANVNGETPEGNCDLCFKKKAARVMSLIRQEPERAVWWARQESIAAQHADGDGALFRNDRASYGQMHRFALDQREMAFDPDEADALPCGCGD